MGDPDGQGFGIFTSSNGGASWERVALADVPPPLLGEFGWASFYEVADNKVWFETNQGRVYFSPNRGHSWEAFEGPLGTQPYSMFAADDNKPLEYHARPAFAACGLVHGDGEHEGGSRCQEGFEAII